MTYKSEKMEDQLWNILSSVFQEIDIYLVSVVRLQAHAVNRFVALFLRS